MTTTADALMTLSDVAALARVQRPVVTMWRARPHATAGAFPAPAAQVRGRQLFDRAQVVAWLRASGRGNNPDAVADEALHARPPVPTPAGLALAEALAIVAPPGDTLTGLDREDLLDLAEEVDPDDHFAGHEIAAADASELAAMAGYVDALLAASLGPRHALDHLRRGPARFGRAGDAGAPSPSVARFVGALAQALADPQRFTGPVPVADPTGCCADLVLAALAARPQAHEGVRARPATAHDAAERAAATRESWRTLVLHEATPEPIDVDDEGHIDITGPAVILARYPHPGAPSLTPEQVLEQIDDVLVQLKNEQRAVILGPAAALTDAQAARGAARRRRAILDSGRLRALVRLGPGSTPAAPQRRLAVWVFGPPPAAGNFRGEGRTVIADLAGLDLARVGDDLVTDVIAAVQDRPLPGADDSQGRAHAFAVARYQRTFQVLARDGDLVPRDLRAAPRRRYGDQAAEAIAAARALAGPLAGVGVEAGVRTEPIGTPVTVRALLDGKRLRLLPGTRVLEEEILGPEQSAAALTVVGVPELSGRRRPGSRVVDHLAFTAAHPRAARTEAGDVVFCIGPQVGSWVDPHGGTVVQAPARYLRVQPRDGHADRVLPRILAADLARGRGSQWRAISTRLVPASDAATLAPVLDALAAARQEALRRLDDLDRLTQAVTLGAVETRLTDMMNPIDQEGH